MRNCRVRSLSVKGHLLLTQDPAGVAEAALLSHRERHRSPPRARLYELRATTEARAMLSEIYGWFTKASTPPANRSSILRPIKQLDDRRYRIWRSPVSDAF